MVPVCASCPRLTRFFGRRVWVVGATSRSEVTGRWRTQAVRSIAGLPARGSTAVQLRTPSAVKSRMRGKRAPTSGFCSFSSSTQGLDSYGNAPVVMGSETRATTASFDSEAARRHYIDSALESDRTDLRKSDEAMGHAISTAFQRIYAQAEWGVEARSGLGSRRETTQEFCCFLEGFLKERRIKSVVDAGCGHWPSGYQRFIDWQGVHYLGVDVVPSVVAESRGYLAQPGMLAVQHLGSATVRCGDIGAALPPADLLLVKDVLMHLPNAFVWRFLESHCLLGDLSRKSPYKAVLLVQNDMPPHVHPRALMDIEAGQLLPFDIKQPPFSVGGFREIFRWQSDEVKTVQLWEPP